MYDKCHVLTLGARKGTSEFVNCVSVLCYQSSLFV